ncbi:MAG: DUF5683 domain-containing protein [Bacteroidota bacterium]
MLQRIFLCIFILLGTGGALSAQDSSATRKIPMRDTTHSVRKATVLSAIIPGAGQVYNRKAWKVPIIYAGFAGLGYLFRQNQKNYIEYEDALLARYDNDPSTTDPYVDIYTDDNLRTLSDFYRRNRDLSFMGITLLYVLNIIDAHVDAHLFRFNMDDNLAIVCSPELRATPSGQITPSLTLSLHF